jgi:hypothetical protein
MKHHAPVGQVHEDHPALKGDNGVEGVAHRRFGGDAAAAVNGEVRVMPVTCSPKRASRQQLSTGVAVLWREREVAPTGPRASLRCGASLGPAHGEGGVVRWLGDGGRSGNHREADGGTYRR